MTSTLPIATARDTLAVLSDVIAPTLAKGVIIRRPRAVALAARLDLDRRAIRRVQRLRDRYGDGPLLLRTPVRTYALILAPAHLRRVLDQAPEPFALASDEKRAALAHFEPRGVLISHGPARADRRRFNEAVLDTPHPAHRLADRFLRVVGEEAEGLLSRTGSRPLTWDAFTATWFRVVRRVVFGDAARDDRATTDLLARLRADANWAFLRPRRERLRQQFDARVRRHLARAEPDSLAAMIAAAPATDDTIPAEQVPQWLFAFDAAGIAIFRALALLATHPQQADRARAEVAAADPGDLPFLRACVLDALRLWPTTPLVLRQTTAPTAWEGGTMPPRTGILIFARFFHRDDRHLPEADRFAPELWLGGRSPDDWPLIPFSAGPGTCPGQNLVLLLTSAMLAALLDRRDARLLSPPRLDPAHPLPATLNHFALRFAFTPRHDTAPAPSWQPSCHHATGTNPQEEPTTRRTTMARDESRSDTIQEETTPAGAASARGDVPEVRARTAPGDDATPAPQHPLGPPPTTLTMPATQRPGGTVAVTPADLRENMLVLGADGDTVGTFDGLAAENTIRLKADTLGQHHWLPLAWVARVDDQAHLDRPTAQARQEWLTADPADA